MHPLPILHSSYLLTQLTTRCSVLLSPNPQLHTLRNNTGTPRLLHPFSFSFTKLIINGQFENRLESPQGCLPCQIEKGQGQVSRLAPPPPVRRPDISEAGAQEGA